MTKNETITIIHQESLKEMDNFEFKAEEGIKNGKYYEIDEARAVTHAKIKERYAHSNRRASNR